MKLRILSSAALALSLMGSAAIAQDSPRILEDQAMMKSFYADDTMTTMRTAEEMKAAFSAMTPDNQAMMKKECMDNQSPKFQDFCGSVKEM